MATDFNGLAEGDTEGAQPPQRELDLEEIGITKEVNVERRFYHDQFGRHYSFCMSCHDRTNLASRLKMDVARNTLDQSWEFFFISNAIYFLAGEFAIQGAFASFTGPTMVHKYGFVFSQRYHQRLYDTGRKAPGLISREVYAGAKGIGVPDELPGFFRYEYGGWEMIHNPATGEVWHLQPIK
jgi:hypothetical protein